MFTYSFLDVQASIVGPGGSFSLGSGAGVAEEGITVAMTEEKNTMMVGADGTPMHSLHAGKSGQVTVRLLKTSPVNNQLAQMYALQTASASLHGANVVTIKNGVTGDQITCRAVAFKKFPDQNNAKDAGINEWTFDAGVIDATLAGLLISALLGG